MHTSPLPVDARQRSFVGVVILLGIATVTIFVGLPEVVSQAANQWHFGESAIGIAVFAEILGMTIGSLAVAFALAKAPVRTTIIVSTVFVVVANLATPLAQGLVAYCLLRLLAGMGSGALNGIAIRYLSYTHNPGKHLGLLMMGETLWSMALLGFILPAIGARWQATGIFRLTAVLMAAFLPIILFFGKNEPLAEIDAETPGDVRRKSAYVTLLALFALYAGVGVVWTFIELLGTQAGLSHNFITNTLSAANLAGVVSCIVVPRFARGTRLYGWTLAMLGTCALSAAALSLPQSQLLFSVATIAFVVGWTAGGVLLYVTIPLYDMVGRHTALSTGFLGLGWGIGSVVGGELLESGYTRTAIAVACLSCLAGVLLYSSLRHAPLASAPIGAKQHA